jgi:hypothetical protein
MSRPATFVCLLPKDDDTTILWETVFEQFEGTKVRDIEPHKLITFKATEYDLADHQFIHLTAKLASGTKDFQIPRRVVTFMIEGDKTDSFNFVPKKS